jgi:Spy/CpxP family protein refolding chaperone
MKAMRGTFTCAAVLAALLGIGGIGLAQGPPGGPMRGPGFGGRGMGPGSPSPGTRGMQPDALERLGLTDAQRRKIDALRDETRREVIRIEADTRIAELDLDRLLDGERPDRAAIGVQADRVAALRARIMKFHLELRLAVHEVLTADQRARLRRMRGAVGEPEPGRSPAR